MIRNSAVLILSLCPMAAALAQTDPPVQLPPVEVTADTTTDDTRQTLEAEQALTPGGVTIVDREEYARRNADTLADMLRYVPGVWTAAGSTGDSSYYSIRGSNLDAKNYDGNGVKLLQDGLPITAADGNNHNRDVDPLSAHYAIVARGANALTYGASTLGGAIDFITPTARDLAPLELFLSGGSHDTYQARATAGTVNGDFDGLITAEAKRTDGYREHQQQQREGLYANAGWQFGDAVQTRFYFTWIDNDQELPGSLTRDQLRENPEQAETAAVDGDYRLNVETWRIANITTWTLDADSSLSVGLSYEDQQLYHPIVFAPPFFSLLIDTEQRNLGSMLRYKLRRGAHDLLVGLNYGQTEVEGANYFYDENGPTELMAPVDNYGDSLELFVMDRWRFASHWTAVYGAQLVVASREVGDLEGDYDSVNPRIGLIRHLAPEIELFANLSRLYEAPTTYELDDTACKCGEPLDAMSGTVLEVGTRGSRTLDANVWRWDLALYYAKLSDEILSKDDPDEPGMGNSLALNVDDTVHAGIEALVGASFALDAAGSHRIAPLVSATWNHFAFDGDATYGDNDLPAAPEYVVRGEVLYRHVSGWFAGPTFDFIGERHADFANTYTVASYELLGLRAGLSRERWEVFAELRNLTDEQYVSFFSVLDAAAPDAAILYPGEPRSAYVGARLRF